MKNKVIRGIIKGITIIGVIVTSYFAGYGVEAFCQDIIDNISEN